MVRTLLLALLLFLLGAAESYFVFPKEKLDGKSDVTIVLWIFGFAFLVWIAILIHIWCSGLDSPSLYPVMALIRVIALFLIGMALYLIYYLCRRIKSFKKLFLLGCIGFAGGLIMLVLGIFVAGLIV